MLIGAIFTEQKEYEKALEYFDKAYEPNPNVSGSLNGANHWVQRYRRNLFFNGKLP